MVMGDNRLLSALMLFNRIEPRLKMDDSRVRIKKAEMDSIKYLVGEVYSTLWEIRESDKEFDLGNLSSSLREISDLVSLCLDDPEFVETSDELKERLCDLFLENKEMFYLFVGKYYTNHDFNYSVGVKRLLTEIVDVCWQQGYYFGFK